MLNPIFDLRIVGSTSVDKAGEVLALSIPQATRPRAPSPVIGRIYSLTTLTGLPAQAHGI